MERKHGRNESFARKEQLGLLLLLGEHGSEQTDAIGGRTDPWSVVQQKPSAVELDRGDAERCGRKRRDCEEIIGGLHLGRTCFGAPIIDVEVVIGDHALLVDLNPVVRERKKIENGDFALGEGDTLVEKGRFPSYR